MKEKKTYFVMEVTVFNCVDHTLVQFHTIELRRGSSYIPSPKWISDIKSNN